MLLCADIWGGIFCGVFGNINDEVSDMLLLHLLFGFYFLKINFETPVYSCDH